MNEHTSQRIPDVTLPASNAPWLQDAGSRRRLLLLALSVGAIVGFLGGIAVATFGTTNIEPIFFTPMGAMGFGLLCLILINIPASQARNVAAYLLGLASAALGWGLVNLVFLGLGLSQASWCVKLPFQGVGAGTLVFGAALFAPRLGRSACRLLGIKLEPTR